ncbi:MULTISPECIES: GGDEF domain-containing phosphodiesterase [unclassified Modicisalibacter]|uniref:putative bifunctional diguanylate cyclase/phosphodiesterase n=1 Tax=unclassified Modicisalibacter TaxID=2679913 RepID=UPI001CCB5BBD|nr:MULTISPECIES: GGDEF domain-containing phosphodiesterase [unclassified Modicisalibacter]MBZ9558817.1 EAL domain-containing protein [Modicisalibacter sp. R2A 31.J]MBZ9575292.1 EAL domain-containing protein [Modicisalibacter sp. MOD 31.J]
MRKTSSGPERPAHAAPAVTSDASDARPASRVFEQANQAMLITDPEGRITDVNPALLRLTGFTREALLGQASDELIVTLKNAPGSGASLSQGRDHGFGEVTYRNRQGRIYPALLSVSRVRGDQGHLSHHVLALSDLTLLSSHSQHASREVYFDALTGLPNHHLLTRLIHESMQHSRRSGQPVTLCALDIDHFKAINDRLGHATGDILLTLFARRLSSLLQGDDVLSRLGGDEFALLLHRPADDGYFDTLLAAIRQPLWIDGHRLQITASLGITFYPSDDVEDDLLLRHATQAMYRAKQSGRDGYHHFDPRHDRKQQIRQARRQRFEQALRQGELTLYYQPQVNMADGRVVGAEALIRWQHPDRGLLLPGSFLPLIEGTPLEIETGEWVIEQALSQLQRWRDDGIMLPVHINISPTHLLTTDFIERLVARLARYPDVPAGHLKLEVLETAAMHDTQAALSAISECQRLGIDIAMDDFGTGFSSLTYLRQLPVDLIKIDQSFVRGMLDDPDDMAIVESVIYMAQRFGRPMLAEGVETLDHAQALLHRGCQLAQGFGIGRPMPAERLATWLTHWPSRSGWSRLGETLQEPTDSK